MQFYLKFHRFMQILIENMPNYSFMHILAKNTANYGFFLIENMQVYANLN